MGASGVTLVASRRLGRILNFHPYDPSSTMRGDDVMWIVRWMDSHIDTRMYSLRSLILNILEFLLIHTF
jgi:hypothetical protein